MTSNSIKQNQKILIDFEKIQDEYNYNLLNNILSALGRYNYTLSLEAIDIFCRLEWNYRVSLLGEINKILYEENKGSNQNLDKFYINYPNTVNSHDKRELYINSLLYYYHNFWKEDSENTFMDKPELNPEIGLIELSLFSDKEIIEENIENINLENKPEEEDENLEIERALEGGRFIENNNLDEESKNELNFHEVEHDDDIDYEEDDLDTDIEDDMEDDLDIDDDMEDDSEEDTEVFINPYEEDDLDTDIEDDNKILNKNLYKCDEIVYNKKNSQLNYSNGRQIDDLIDRRQYLELIKFLKKEPNELARKLIFILEGIFYQVEDRNDRIKHLSKILGIFEGIISAIACDTLKALKKEIKYKISYFNIDEDILKIYKDLYLIVVEEISDRK